MKNVKATHVDAFRWRGLSKTSWRVWRVLSSAHGLSTKDITERVLGIHSGTVRRALRRLEAVDLARGTDGRWYLGDADLEEIAHRVGTAGTGERQRRQHLEERRTYRDYLAAAHRRRDQAAQPQSGPDSSHLPGGTEGGEFARYRDAEER